MEEIPWREYREALHRFVLRRVGDEAAAEDIVQDVLVKAYGQRETLRTSTKLRSWLYQITRNAVVDYYRSHKRFEALPEEFASEAADGDACARQELARCLVPLLDTLPDPYRRALRLADFEGVRQREIALRLGLSLSGAKSRVQRARAMLRDALLECCSVELDHRGRAVGIENGKACERC